MADTFTLADLEVVAQAASVPKTPVIPVETPTPETSVIAADTSTQPEAEAPSVPAPEVVDVVADTAESTPAEAAAVTAETVAADEQADPEVETTPKGSRARERIEGLVDQVKALREYAELWRAKALEGVKPSLPETPSQPSVASPVAQIADAAPTLESCDMDTAKWAQQMTAYTQRQIQSGIQAAITGVKQQQTQEAVRAAFVAREEAYAKVHPDYLIAIGNKSLPQLDRTVAELLVTEDYGISVMHHLAKHPDLAVRIARQNPAQQAASIGSIRAELAAPKPTSPPKIVPPKNNVTKAPAPPTPVPAGGALAKDPMSMEMNEFVAGHRREKIERRKLLAPTERARR